MQGKVVVVTGAGRGIGRAEAHAFAREGASVLVNDAGTAPDGSGASPDPANDVVREILAAGGKAAASHVSVGTESGPKEIVELAVQTFGRLDVLVNNAGIMADRAFFNLRAADWKPLWDVHVQGTFLCSQHAAKHMVAQGQGGRIVVTTSLAGFLGNTGQAAYASVNAALYGLMRTMSIELQKHNITVNALAPLAKTRLTENLPMFQDVSSLTPDHVAPAALFLGSDLCGERTGHVLSVAGSRVSLYKMTETYGAFQENHGGVWTPEEIADRWDAVASGKL